MIPAKAIMAVNLVSQALNQNAGLEIKNKDYLVSSFKITFQKSDEFFYVWYQELHDKTRDGRKGPARELYCGKDTLKAAPHFVKYGGVDSAIAVSLKFFRNK